MAKTDLESGENCRAACRCTSLSRTAIGRMERLGFSLCNEAVLQTLTEDVLKSSEIEGEKLDRDQVRSSIARRLGLDIGGLLPVDRHIEGFVEMMLDANGH